MTQTKKLNQPSKKRRRPNGTASLSFDRGCMRIKFPAAYAQETWGEPQVYFYLGLHHNSEYQANLILAGKIEDRINDDLKRGTVDTSFDVYRQMVEDHKAFNSKCVKDRPMGFKDILGGIFHRETLSSVYERYAQYRKRSLAETTFISIYWGTAKRLIDNCPQDLNKPDQIANYILDNCAKSSAKKTLALLGEVLDWAQASRIISHDIPNPYKYDAARINVPKSNRTPEKVKELEDNDEIDVKDLDVFSFPPDEVAAII